MNMDGDEAIAQFTAWMASTVTYAYVSTGVIELAELSMRVKAVVDDVWHSVQGNRPTGSKISEGDTQLLIEGTLRRCVAILDMAQVRA